MGKLLRLMSTVIAINIFGRQHWASRMPEELSILDSLMSYPAALERHRLAPLYKERVSFLAKLRTDGQEIKRLRTVASLLLQLIRLLRLREMRDIHFEELRTAAHVWQTYSGPGRLGKPGKSATKCFMQVGREWLCFHGRLICPHAKPVPSKDTDVFVSKDR